MFFDESSLNLTKEQALLLLSSMERNEDLALDRIDDSEKSKQLWAEIAANLNAIGDEKDWKTWKEIWQQLVQKTMQKNINAMDVRIMNIFGHRIAGAVTPRNQVSGDSNGASVSNQEELYVVEDNPMKVHNRVLTHILSETIAHTRVVGVGFNTLNDNLNKIYKVMKKKKRMSSS